MKSENNYHYTRLFKVLDICKYCTWVNIKVTRFVKLFVIRQSVLNKILAPGVFNNVDSKYEGWHRAKKIRKVFMD